jgi:hypothetical protein
VKETKIRKQWQGETRNKIAMKEAQKVRKKGWGRKEEKKDDRERSKERERERERERN